MSYNQNNFNNPNKIRSGLHIAACIIAIIMVGAFAMGVLSALLEMGGVLKCTRKLCQLIPNGFLRLTV
jgi:Na+/pantothenate symporter